MGEGDEMVNYTPNFKLIVLQGKDKEKEFTFTKKRIIIGRAKDCDIIIDDPIVSRKHAEVSCEGGSYFIRDLESRNGTFVNDEEVKVQRKLEEGDRIQIGNTIFSFHAMKGKDKTRIVKKSSKGKIDQWN